MPWNGWTSHLAASFTADTIPFDVLAPRRWIRIPATTIATATVVASLTTLASVYIRLLSLAGMCTREPAIRRAACAPALRARERRNPAAAGFLSAPRETRTPTGHTAHKALNLARLPIPPQARAGANYSVGNRSGELRLKSSEGVCTLRTHVRINGKNPASEGELNGRVEPHQAPAGDLRLHQALFRGPWLPADRAGHRKGHRAHLVVDRSRPPREPGEAGRVAARSHQAPRDGDSGQGQ